MKVPATQAQHRADFYKSRSLYEHFMVSFAYRESHQAYYDKPELVSSTAQANKAVQKSNWVIKTLPEMLANLVQRAALAFSVAGSVCYTFIPKRQALYACSSSWKSIHHIPLGFCYFTCGRFAL